MKKFSLSAAIMFAGMSMTGAAYAGDPASCATVRMAEPGWNDLAFTTAVTSVILEGLDYKAKSSLLGLSTIYKSLENKELDLFLGYWDPAMIKTFASYKAKGVVDTVRTNLTGAKYTLAVPTYAWEKGVKDFSDLHKFADKFDNVIYGIEPGSNTIMFSIIDDKGLQLDGWKVVESSEQGMLAEVARKTRREQWIVFLGWAPHPMNEQFDFKYLTGGDNFFGPDFGAATVWTQVRHGYIDECPNVGALLKNLAFDVEFENKGMGYLIQDKMPPVDAAIKALREEPQRLDAWLNGVTTLDGEDGLAAVKAHLGL
jgi:glycine betaine/proline transport system substrate-binding protein